MATQSEIAAIAAQIAGYPKGSIHVLSGQASVVTAALNQTLFVFTAPTGLTTQVLNVIATSRQVVNTNSFVALTRETAAVTRAGGTTVNAAQLNLNNTASPILPVASCLGYTAPHTTRTVPVATDSIPIQYGDISWGGNTPKSFVYSPPLGGGLILTANQKLSLMTSPVVASAAPLIDYSLIVAIF